MVSDKATRGLVCVLRVRTVVSASYRNERGLLLLQGRINDGLD